MTRLPIPRTFHASGATLLVFLWASMGVYAEDRVEIERVRDSHEFVLRLLLDRYAPEPEDPEYIRDDLSTMASYYAEFPEVVEILESIEPRSWGIKYREKTWATSPSGSPLRLRGLTVFFDPRTGGQVIKNRKCKDRPICRLSPADTFLHEMLHVRIILLEFQKYIAQGGMSSAIYPLQHESDVIRQERELLKRMSELDGKERPSRIYHASKSIPVT